MFCSKCGNKLNDTDKFCAKCGTKVKDLSLEKKSEIKGNEQLLEVENNSKEIISEEQYQKILNSETEPNEDNLNNESVDEQEVYSNKILFIIKILAVIGLVCFFFPFATVSCSGTDVDSMTGYELVTGTFDYNEDEDEDTITVCGKIDSTVNIFLVFVILCAMGILFFKNSSELDYSYTYVWLIIFSLSAKSYYYLNDSPLKDYDGIDIKFNTAFYVCTLIYIIIDILIYLQKHNIKIKLKE